MKGEDSSAPATVPQNVVPLRTILKIFLNLVENCEDRRSGGLDLYDKEFQELKQFSESLKSDPEYQCKEGEKSVNRKKNRYKDILPFDYSRVSLSDYGEIPGSDYLNANFIKGASGSSAYVACQGPLPHTVNDFWRMVVECEVQVIVMACMEQESGKHKCENYWVEEDGVERQFGQVTVWLKKSRNVCPDFLVRTMRIRYPSPRGEMEERNVCQFHYSAWPDHGVPTKVRPLLDMVRLIRDCQTSETLPVLVHCSAGCGRTGTICAIDYVWGLLRLGKLTPDFSLFHLVREMRRQRIAMVQTKDQYILVHRAVKELFQEQLKIIDAHPYANVDQNGLPLDIKQDLEEPMYETIDFQTVSRVLSPLPSPPRAAGDISDNNNSQPKAFSKPSTKLPSATSRSKLKKEAENHQKHLEQENSRGTASSSDSVRLKKVDYINTTPAVPPSADDLSESDTPDGSPKVKGAKVLEPVGSQSKASSLLRKPSIVKLKAFFEKSPKEEKDKKSAPVTTLSRAKSDVSSSSRFYSFASSFGGSRGNVNCGSRTSKSSSPSPNKDKADAVLLKATRTESPSKTKPLILAKPSLPVKRSKSLKIHPGDSAKPPSSFGLEPRSSPQLSSSKITASSIPNDNPIRVCVKQVEIPKLQSVVSSSVKPEALSATTYQAKFLLDPLIQGSRSESDSSPTRGKPTLPSKVNVLKDKHTYVNVVYETSKGGGTKDLEDVVDFGRDKSMNFNKFDTVNPKNLSSLGGTALTRSQSHVWTPDRVTLTDRIFSNDNLSKSNSEEEKRQKYAFSSKCSLDKPSALPPKSSPRNHSADLAFSNGEMPLSPLLGNPIVRRRMPKNNAYSNYPIERSSPSGASFQQTEEPSPNKSKGFTYPLNNNGHINGHVSRGNSSDSSNSSPSTPTHSIDVLYSPLRNNYGQNNAGPLQRSLYSTHPAPTPKSILKGSLSSTPSESDERLDSCRSGPHNNTSVTTISSNGVSGRLTTVGVRERRNSFRQAVWKEAQNDGQQQYQQPAPPIPNYLSASALCQNNVGLPSSSESNDGLGARTHKDYEPIWPDGPTPKNPFRVSSTMIGCESRSSPPVSKGPAYSQYSRAGPDEVRTTCSTPYQSRVEDIKVMLEELRAPMGAAGGSQTPSTELKSKANNLKYQRSLKASSRSQYQDSAEVGTLSCFTFRKPSSLESITDQVPVEVDEEYRSLLTPRALLPKPEGLQSLSTVAAAGPSRGVQSGRTSNDYVTLTQCRTSNWTEEEGRENGQYNTYHEITPIPPPRTKAKKSHYYKVGKDVAGSDGLDSCPPEKPPESSASRAPLSVWIDESPRARSGSGSEDVPDGKLGPIPGNNHRAEPSGGTTSPKAFGRAIGLFQAKAANVRSKFANWTENSWTSAGNSGGSERSSSTKRSGQSNGSAAESTRGQAQDDHGFTSPLHVSSRVTAVSGLKRTTKHQYL